LIRFEIKPDHFLSLLSKEIIVLMRSRLFSPAALRPIVVFGSAAIWLLVASLAPGCGPGKPEFSPETRQTPESLAQEFAFRYQGLPAQASGKAKARAAAVEKAKAKFAQNDADEKGKGARNAATKKASLPVTLDALIDSLEARLDQVPGMSRREAAGKVLERLKVSPAIDEADRTVVVERLTAIANGP
jgi:hypothetical protein